MVLHLQSLFPSMMLGGLGGLGVWSFAKKIDEAEMRADDAFFSVKDNVERRSGLSEGHSSKYSNSLMTLDMIN